MKNSGKLVSFLVPIISILLAFVIGCIIMAVLGANPFVALESLWIGAFGSLRNVGTTLARSTPLIFTSLCACFAYRCGVFNLGGEGQFLMGSIVCHPERDRRTARHSPVSGGRRRGWRPLVPDFRPAEGLPWPE